MDKEVLRQDFKRYLELALKPLWEKLDFKDDVTTEKLYETIIEANMLSVDRYTQAQVDEAVRSARIDERRKIINQKFESKWGMNTLKAIADGIRVAENGGDIRECSDDLDAFIAQLTTQSKAKEAE